ncbi:AEC family transporter [Dorea ammoniilytica]
MLLLQQMLVLFIYMMLGFFLARKGVLDERAGKTFSWMVVNVANPALIILPTINKETTLSPEQIWEALKLAVIMYVALIVIAKVITMFMRTSMEKNLYQMMMVFNNIAFMGFPIVAAAYGPDALLYSALFTLPFCMLIYTYGIVLITANGEKQEKLKLRSIFNIGVIAVIFALAMLFIKPNMPEFVITATKGVSNLTGPLSMMVIGISLAGMKLKDVFCDKTLWLFSFVKLLVIPIIGTLIVIQLLDNDLLCHVCMVMLGTPVASMVVMLAQTYDADSELMSRGVALTTILSVITIPMVSFIVF